MDLQKNIASGLQKLRQERNLSQAELAKVLSVSQPTLSLIESGKGSLTAEQFLNLLQYYNLGLDYFVPTKPGHNKETEIQNVLARFGAKHLRESTSVFLSETYDVNKLFFDVLSSPISSRHLTALAPIMVRQIANLNFLILFIELKAIARERKLFWFLENLDAALTLRWRDILTTEQKRNYRLVRRIIKEEFETLLLDYQKNKSEWRETVVIRGVSTSLQSRLKMQEKSDAIAIKWLMITDLTSEDFYKALVEADENDR